MLVGALLVLVQACGISVPSSGWGLDASWSWMTDKAAQSLSYGHGTYIWTYGPLSFLDHQQSFWPFGQVCELLFRIFAGLLFYIVFLQRIRTLFKVKKVWPFLIATLVTTVIYTFNTPSIMLLATAYIFLLSLPNLKIQKIRNEYVIVAVSIFSAFEFYIKTVQFVIAGVISVAIIASTKNVIKNLIGFFVATFGIIGSVALLLNFNFHSMYLYLRGSYELTIGYKAMAIEDPNRILEYPIVFLLLAYLFFKTIKSKFSFVVKNVIFISNVISFEYGFTRHDGHSVYAFMWISLTLLILLTGSDIESRSGIILFSFFSIIALFLASQFSFLSMIDVTSRIQQNLNGVRSLNAAYRENVISQDMATLRNNARVPQSILNQLGNSTVSVLPFDQLAAKAYNLNLEQPPVPQFYSAYTPWLDKQNSDFFNSSNRPEYVLEEAPAAIDGRNPIWEAPASQLAIFCNYSSYSNNTDWLLLKSRGKSICGTRDTKNVGGSVFKFFDEKSSKNIYLFNIKNKTSLPGTILRIFFKPLHHDLIRTSRESFTYVTKNNKGLILSVPKNLDYPGKWSLNRDDKLQSEVGVKFVIETVMITS
jgi:hypothetical protein